jgi:hypothetical protein
VLTHSTVMRCMIEDSFHTGGKLINLPRMTIVVTLVSGSLFTFCLVTFSQFRLTLSMSHIQWIKGRGIHKYRN